jgi:hypothetical protein
MKQEWLFLIHNKRKLHPNDFANALYSRVLFDLFTINEDETICFIKAIEDEEDLMVVSPCFAPLAGKFQSEKFIKTIEEIVERFKNSKWYQFLQQDVLEAKKAMDNYQNE